MEFNENTFHYFAKTKPKNINDEDFWIQNRKSYDLYHGSKSYEVNTSNYNELSQKKDEFRNYIKKLLSFDSTANLFKVSLNGINGYNLTYEGKNKKIIQSLELNNVKNVKITVKVGHNSELREMNIFIIYNDKSTQSIQIEDINKINSLEIPDKVKDNTN